MFRFLGFYFAGTAEKTLEFAVVLPSAPSPEERKGETQADISSPTGAAQFPPLGKPGQGTGPGGSEPVEPGTEQRMPRNKPTSDQVNTGIGGSNVNSSVDGKENTFVGAF